MSDPINAATKYAATLRPDSLGWFEPVGPDIVEGVRRLTSHDGPDVIVWGSSTLTSTLLEHGLAEEVVLFVCPVLLGRGMRLFAEGTAARALELTNSRTLPSGTAMQVYGTPRPLTNHA